jgi:serine protease AprX
MYCVKGNKMLFGSLRKIVKPLTLVILVTIATAIAIYNVSVNPTETKDEAKLSYIISAQDFDLLQLKIAELNVVPSHDLAIIKSVAVTLSESQLATLKQNIDIKVSLNHKVELSNWGSGHRSNRPDAEVADHIDASVAHSYYNFGDGVTIGFLDTGLDQLYGLSTDLYGYDKAWGTYDAITDTVYNYAAEFSGHGTHVASIATNSDFDTQGRIFGVAPNAAIVGIKAFDQMGQATYADVIRGIDWAVQVKDLINLRVLNMSFSGTVQSNYWDDPLNLAVMKAWQEGLVVVASAGNTGPDPMTIGVPGNVPYIITVGAMTDDYTPEVMNDDKLASFSSAGPTYEGFVKPEIVAPGGHLPGLMSFDTQIAYDHPEYHDGGRYFQMSGTSQAAAVVSGVVALMLTEQPWLTPDEVKCRLMDGARLATTNNNELAYSVFQQGAGVVNAADSLASVAANCANTNLDINKDLAGIQHFSGSANVNEDGDFFIEGLGQEYVWQVTEEFNPDIGYMWNNDKNVDMFIWENNADLNASGIFIWRTNAELSTDGIFIWRTSAELSVSGVIAVNNWVEQQ